MTKPIRTYKDLLEEKERLKLLLSAQKELIRQDINQVKQELAPVRSAVSIIGKVVTKDKSSWVLSTAADTIIDMVVKRMVLAKAGWFTKLVVPFFMKNFSSHVIADNKDKIISKLSSWFSKKNANGKAPISEEEAKRFAEEEED
ncbi:MAG TPA: hypothetical protein VJU78_20100 [Chitinophagaceae bacterium]|nr:hypothetical protein [Chitinophagaceae bacterium]